MSGNHNVIRSLNIPNSLFHPPKEPTGYSSDDCFLQDFSPRVKVVNIVSSLQIRKKTEDEILGEFLDTFEMHHSNCVPFTQVGGMGRDKSVTMEEFKEYYNHISASNVLSRQMMTATSNL